MAASSARALRVPRADRLADRRDQVPRLVTILLVGLVMIGHDPAVHLVDRQRQRVDVGHPHLALDEDPHRIVRAIALHRGIQSVSRRHLTPPIRSLIGSYRTEMAPVVAAFAALNTA